MPPYLPLHRFLVYVSGAFEIALAVSLLIPRLTSLSAWGLIALLIAVFPANIHMALHPDLFQEFNPTMLCSDTASIRTHCAGLLVPAAG